MTAPQRVMVLRCPDLVSAGAGTPGREAARRFERVLAALADLGVACCVGVADGLFAATLAA
ncbi:MAG: hypothetical protein JO132_12670, partial [Streptosporangiaceae bacterium]|nr:hypothetical protein [Streptosporangiaceae bacterium]